MRTYERMIGNDKYQFRLTAGAQKVLEKRFDATGLQLILESAANAERMTAILGASANYKGNENPTVDGEMIYDLLVDDGVAGEDGFFEISLGIAVASGIMNETNAGKTMEAITKAVEETYASLDPTGEKDAEAAEI